MKTLCVIVNVRVAMEVYGAMLNPRITVKPFLDATLTSYVDVMLNDDTATLASGLEIQLTVDNVFPPDDLRFGFDT